MYEDKTLVCKDCGKEFVFTAGEQEFYAEKGFTNEPQRCKECRDNVGHMLTRALLQTGALAVCVKEEPLKASVAALQETLDSAMTSIRSSVHKLHDDAIPLEKSVQDCLQPLKDTYHITLTYDISEQIPSIVKLCLLGVLKESLSNVVKHSNGDAIQIVLREHPAFYQLSITDNGTPVIKQIDFLL